jgi:hypothetical protein
MEQHSEAILDPLMIAVAEEETRRARTALNASSPLCQLPNELLARILDYARIGPDGEDYGPSTMEWACVMLICTHVYAVAISTPSLWTYILCHYEKATLDMLLVRAGMMPLSLTALLGWLTTAEEWQGPWDNAAKLLGRSRSAILGLNDAYFDDEEGIDTSALIQSLNESAPFLEVLDCSNLRISERFIMSCSFLGGSCQRLVDLAVAGVVLTDTSPEFPVLRSLRLMHAVCGEEHADLRAMLSKMPTLECLWLLDPEFGSNHSDEDEEEASLASLASLAALSSKNYSKINLPFLRTLHLWSRLAVLSSLLSFLPDPSTNFHLHFHPFESSSFWNPDTQSYHIKILDRMRRFWLRTTSQKVLPNGNFRVWPAFPVEDTGSKDELNFSWDDYFFNWGWDRNRDVFEEPYLHYRAFGRISGECAAFGDVETFSGFDVDWTILSLQPYVDLLPSIENIVIGYLTGWENAQPLLDWIQSRHALLLVLSLTTVQWEWKMRQNTLQHGGGAHSFNISTVVPDSDSMEVEG